MPTSKPPRLLALIIRWHCTLAGFLALLSVGARAEESPPCPERTAEFEVAAQRDVMIPMRDGVRLAADIYLPAQNGKSLPGPFPALLQRTPYGKGQRASDEVSYMVQRGYAVVMNDTRGRYGSEGTWRLIVDDPDDGHDIVEWIAAQPWSNGQVGTFGTSYGGGTQHALATRNPPHLTTMVPVDALSNCGVAGMRHGGAFELRFMNWSFNQGASNCKAALADPAMKAALDEQARRIREYTDRFPVYPGTTPLRLAPEYESWLVQAIRSGPEDPFWHLPGMSVVDHLDTYADVPALHVTGWYDSWTRQVCMNYEALSTSKKSPQFLLIGPWVHGAQRSHVSGEVEFTPEAALKFDALRLRWYDFWMKDTPASGSPLGSPVWIYVMGTGDDSRSPQGRLRHGGYWRAEKKWPLQETRGLTLFLHESGRLDPAPPAPPAGNATIYTFDPTRPVPTIGGNISSNSNLMSSGGYDQRPRDDTHPPSGTLPLSTRNDVLVFRTEPLVSDIEVTGTVKVALWVGTTGRDTDFTAKLIDEIPPNADYPLGYDLNIGDSITRLRYRNGVDRPAELLPIDAMTPLGPAQELMATAQVAITLYPTSNVFKKGHRIRLDVSSSNYPRFDVNPNTGEPLGRHRGSQVVRNAVLHDAQHPSSLVLPTIPR